MATLKTTATPTTRNSATIIGASVVTILQVLMTLGWLPTESVNLTAEATQTGAEIAQAIAGLYTVWGLRRAANSNLAGVLRVSD